MSTPSPLDDGLTPERFTEVLRGSGALDGGRVVEVAVETSRTTLISTIDRLRLRYAGGGGPATLIRKEPRQDIAPDLASLLGREVVAWKRRGPATGLRPLVDELHSATSARTSARPTRWNISTTSCTDTAS